MDIEEIPADELLTMTNLWHRAFNAAGCNPMCHCCKNMIPIGNKFKLATVEKIPTKDFQSGLFYAIDAHPIVQDFDKEIETKEVMLCNVCTAEIFLEKQKIQLDKNLQFGKRLLAKRKEEGGCFRINGKIIH